MLIWYSNLFKFFLNITKSKRIRSVIKSFFYNGTALMKPLPIKNLFSETPPDKRS